MQKATYFISDIHLGASYISDPLAHERRVVKWLDSIKGNAKAIYLLGDILDYWYEYKYVVPRGYTRFFGKIAELTDMGIEIYWFIGNHDIWIFDYLPSEIGVKVIDGYTVKKIDGQVFFLSHGDGVGKRSIGFRFIRSLFRNRFCQILFSTIHPRWTVPFAHKWSSHSRTAGHSDSLHNCDDKEKFLIQFSKDFLNTCHIDHFVYGHLHVALQDKIAQNSDVTILGDWIDTFSYGIFDEQGFRLEYLK